MRFLRRNRFLLIFVVLLVFCSLMMIRQVAANRSRHIEMREEFILLCMKGYKPEAERLYTRLLRDIEQLPHETLKDDFMRTSLLVNPNVQQPDNLIWKYYWTTRKEWENRSENVLPRER